MALLLPMGQGGRRVLLGLRVHAVKRDGLNGSLLSAEISVRAALPVI
jgi:hypothetical protein